MSDCCCSHRPRAGARYTRILPQLAPERRPPVSNFGYTCAPGPPSRVHRACPIYFLGLSSFRRSAFEVPKGAKNAASGVEITGELGASSRPSSGRAHGRARGELTAELGRAHGRARASSRPSSGRAHGRARASSRPSSGRAHGRARGELTAELTAVLGASSRPSSGRAHGRARGELMAERTARLPTTRRAVVCNQRRKYGIRPEMRTAVGLTAAPEAVRAAFEELQRVEADLRACGVA